MLSSFLEVFSYSRKSLHDQILFLRSQAHFCLQPSNQNKSKLFWRRTALVLYWRGFFIYIWSWERKHPIPPFTFYFWNTIKYSFLLGSIFLIYLFLSFLSSSNYLRFLAFLQLPTYWICNENSIIAHISNLSGTLFICYIVE